MRAKIFLLKASCILLSAFFICGNTAPLAFCQKAAAGIGAAQPEFMTGLEMALHYKKEVIINFVQTQKSEEPPVNAPTPPITEPKNAPDTKAAIVADAPASAISNAPVENKENAPQVANETPAIENKEPADITVTKPAPAPLTGTTIITINETHPKFNDPGSFIEEMTDPVISKYADMISVEPSEISNYPLYRFIDKWYGTRYKWGGTDHSGIDCSAFSQKLYSQVYNTEISRTSREQHRSCERIKDYNDASEGDLIFFRIHRIRISHVGIYLANGFFVHASRTRGVMISSLDSKYWSRRYAGCGRVEREDNIVSESDFAQ